MSRQSLPTSSAPHAAAPATSPIGKSALPLVAGILFAEALCHAELPTPVDSSAPAADTPMLTLKPPEASPSQLPVTDGLAVSLQDLRAQRLEYSLNLLAHDLRAQEGQLVGLASSNQVAELVREVRRLQAAMAEANAHSPFWDRLSQASDAFGVWAGGLATLGGLTGLGLWAKRRHKVMRLKAEEVVHFERLTFVGEQRVPKIESWHSRPAGEIFVNPDLLQMFTRRLQQCGPEVPVFCFSKTERLVWGTLIDAVKATSQERVDRARRKERHDVVREERHLLCGGFDLQGNRWKVTVSDFTPRQMFEVLLNPLDPFFARLDSGFVYNRRDRWLPYLNWLERFVVAAITDPGAEKLKTTADAHCILYRGARDCYPKNTATPSGFRTEIARTALEQATRLLVLFDADHPQSWKIIRQMKAEADAREAVRGKLFELRELEEQVKEQLAKNGIHWGPLEGREKLATYQSVGARFANLRGTLAELRREVDLALPGKEPRQYEGTRDLHTDDYPQLLKECERLILQARGLMRTIARLPENSPFFVSASVRFYQLNFIFEELRESSTDLFDIRFGEPRRKTPTSAPEYLMGTPLPKGEVHRLRSILEDRASRTPLLDRIISGAMKWWESRRRAPQQGTNENFDGSFEPPMDKNPWVASFELTDAPDDLGS